MKQLKSNKTYVYAIILCSLDLTEFAPQLVSTAPYVIKAAHTSPGTKNVNDLQFLLEQSTVCKVTVRAFSYSSEQVNRLATSF